MTEEQGWRDLGERITRLETLVGELPGRINEQITARDNATRQLVAFNQERLSQLQNDTVKLTSMVDSLHKRVDKGDHVTGTLRTQQPNLEAKVDQLEDQVQNLKDQLRSARGFLVGAAAAGGVTGGGLFAAAVRLFGG